MSEEHHDAVRRGYDALGRTYHEERTREDAPSLPALDRFTERLSPGARVLDVGCGAGVPATERLAERHEVVGFDVSRGQLSLAREHVPGAALVHGDMTALPFEAGAFDGLVALYSVIHVPREEHAGVFSGFRRVLRPGGVALLAVGIDAWEGRNPDWLDSGAEMRWSFHDYGTTLDLLSEAGFAVIEETRLDDALGGGQFGLVTVRSEV